MKETLLPLLEKRSNSTQKKYLICYQYRVCNTAIWTVVAVVKKINILLKTLSSLINSVIVQLTTWNLTRCLREKKEKENKIKKILKTLYKTSDVFNNLII